ncbi:MAG: hypothetical protein HQL64_09875 [Magnetococcales bacterium]|nr:hypothetical protein [Magnetococcales bacterium]
MAITDLNANLLPNEKLTLVGPGRVEFIGTQPEAAAPTPAAGAKGAATATPAAIKGGMTTTAISVPAKAATAATAQGVIWKGTGWSLGLGLGLGPVGTIALGSLLLGGGYYLYKRRRNAQSLWPF